MHPADDQRGELHLSPLETPTILCPSQADGETRFYSLKKVLKLSAFFIVCYFSISTQAIAEECGVNRYDATAKVLRVVDGDTVILSNKQKVRLIGINAPERARYPKKAEAYASAAKRYLKRQLATNKKIHLKFGRQKKDRYGRLLAHILLSDGRNLNAMLVKQGLASAIVVPPNTAFINCYFRLEQQARKKAKNIWSANTFKVIPASQLKLKDTGFAFIKGNVMRVGKSRDSIWLQLAPEFTLRIKRKDFKYFKSLNLNSIKLEDLKDKTLFARGWIHERKKELYMQVRHPKMISGF